MREHLLILFLIATQAYAAHQCIHDLLNKGAKPTYSDPRTGETVTAEELPRFRLRKKREQEDLIRSNKRSLTVQNQWRNLRISIDFSSNNSKI